MGLKNLANNYSEYNFDYLVNNNMLLNKINNLATKGKITLVWSPIFELQFERGTTYLSLDDIIYDNHIDLKCLFNTKIKYKTLAGKTPIIYENIDDLQHVKSQINSYKSKQLLDSEEITILENLEQSYKFAFIQQFTHTNLRVIYLPVLQAIKFYGEIIRYKVKTMESVLPFDQAIKDYYSSSDECVKAWKDCSKTRCCGGCYCGGSQYSKQCYPNGGGGSCSGGGSPSPAPVSPSPAPVSPSPAPVSPSPAPVSPTPNCADASNCKHKPTPLPGPTSDKKYVMYLYIPSGISGSNPTKWWTYPEYKSLNKIDPTRNVTHLHLAFFSPQIYNATFVKNKDNQGNYYYNSTIHLMFLPINEYTKLWNSEQLFSKFKSDINYPKIIASIGGSLANWPSSSTNAMLTAQSLIHNILLKYSSFDGIDIDYEVEPVNQDEVNWLQQLAKSLYEGLSKEKKKYSISFSPVAKYFGGNWGGYAGYNVDPSNIYIDYYAIMYYGNGCLIKDYNSMFERSNCAKFQYQIDLKSIHTNYKIPYDKMLVGKPYTPVDGGQSSASYIPIQEFASILKTAYTNNISIGGISFWKWGANTDPTSNIHILKTALEDGKIISYH